MRLVFIIHLALASLASIASAQDVLFPYMHGLKYSEYNETVKLGLSAHVCKDEAEWYSMTTADFAKYKAIIVPDCLCNTSLSTIKFLDDTKKVWSPAVTGNMILIGTDPSFHAKWFGLPGAYAMMKDAISHVTLGNKDGTGMYFSLSCYYQSNSSQMAVQSLSEIGNFQVRGNLSHPCLNDAHLVATSDVMISLNDGIASDWNCSVHEVFSDYPREGSGGFNALAVAVNASGPGQQEFADGTVGIPYIIARGATPVGCGNNVTDTKFHEQCDEGKANGTPESLCSASCKCIYGMISPGLTIECSTDNHRNSFACVCAFLSCCSEQQHEYDLRQRYHAARASSSSSNGDCLSSRSPIRITTGNRHGSATDIHSEASSARRSIRITTRNRHRRAIISVQLWWLTITITIRFRSSHRHSSSAL
ncbi:hypothetical protein N0V85_001479 [Neurospora sp. IMI 360204]|nr:hypothetical protein N0V85_001479 [Neurospora sp. IMI 360204]